jgi:hypothetical protein
MTRPRTSFACALLTLATASSLLAAVDPGLLEMTPPDTRFLAGLQVQQAIASPFGHFALSQMPEQSAVLLQLAATTGFDLRRDLREVLLASHGQRGKIFKDGVLLARGTFQMDRLLVFAEKVHAKLSNYAGVPLITLADKGASSIAIIDSSTLAVGPELALQGVINRHMQKFLFSGALADKAALTGANADAWVATVTPLARVIPSSNGGVWPLAFLQAVLESSAGLRFDTGGITLSAEAITHSPTEAAGIAGMFKIIAGMLKNAESSLLQGARFTTEGNATRFTLTVAEQDLERAFPAPAQKRAAR